MYARCSLRWVEQKLVLAVCTFAHVDAWLFLLGKTLSEEIEIIDHL